MADAAVGAVGDGAPVVDDGAPPRFASHKQGRVGAGWIWWVAGGGLRSLVEA